MQKMKTAGLAAVLAMIVIGMTPLVLADELPSEGEATGNNIAPEVMSVTAPSPVDPQTPYDFSCTVRDNNTLEDITTVELILYLSTAEEGAEDAIENHYTFKYTAGAPTWEEIGPSPTDNHLIVVSCTEPENLKVQSDNYSFAIILSGAATPSEWTAIWIATDDNGLTDNKENTFTVTQYISLAIDDTKLTFSGDPGDENIEPSEQPTVCTVTSNYVFNIQASLSDNWTGSAYGEKISMSNTKAARDAAKTDLKTLSDAPADIWTGLGPGEDVGENIYWFLDLPVPLRDDVYTTTFSVGVT